MEASLQLRTPSLSLSVSLGESATGFLLRGYGSETTDLLDILKKKKSLASTEN
jgi:hypothetical protein